MVMSQLFAGVGGGMIVKVGFWVVEVIVIVFLAVPVAF